MTSIKDAVAVVTGGSRGIGKALVEAPLRAWSRQGLRDRPRAIGAASAGAVDRQADAEISLEHAAPIVYYPGK